MTITDKNEIRPYPTHLIRQYTLLDGTIITIRPTSPDDAKILKVFGSNLSDELKHLNYMETFHDLPDSMVKNLTEIDYKKTMTLIASYFENEAEIVVGMVHYVSKDGENCEFDMIVTDDWQNLGIGTILTEALIKAAKDNGMKSIKIIILSSNISGMRLAKNFGFTIDSSDHNINTIIKKLV
jgi:acetyltransferase